MNVQKPFVPSGRTPIPGESPARRSSAGHPNAGRRSQSSKNNQPWQFIAIREKSTLKAISNRHLCRSPGGAVLAVAILVPAQTSAFQALFDAGQAAAYMQLAAWELGVGSGWHRSMSRTKLYRY